MLRARPIFSIEVYSTDQPRLDGAHQFVFGPVILLSLENNLKSYWLLYRVGAGSSTGGCDS